jgi:hypothetical protein
MMGPRLSLRGAALAVALFALLPASASALPNGRSWELVSPVEKNGGSVPGPEGVLGGGVYQAAADGDSVTYSSATAFLESAGAPPGSQYLSTRGSAGWATQNLNVALFSGSYGPDPDGVPYQLFSTDLAAGLLLNGEPCRAEDGSCPVANPPLPATDAPAGYQNYYLRRGGTFEALIGAADVANTALDPAHFRVRFAGASVDLEHLLVETCAALTPDASEVAQGEGCDPNAQNLYEWSGGDLELLAGPGASLAAQAGAVSSDGSRIYYVDTGSGELLLSDAGTQRHVDADAGQDGVFQTATPDGAVAFFTTAAAHLWRYSAASDAATDLTPGGGVVGVLGASEDGDSVYYQGADGLYLWQAGSTAKVADGAAADPSDYPPATGTARVSADGSKLLFLSSSSLTGYDNLDQKTGLADSEVFLYDAAAEELHCISCRPSGQAPRGPSTIPGAYSNGDGAGVTQIYKPRVLVADGGRIYFNSLDSLAGSDTNGERDAYQWEPPGPECGKPAGCIELISSGRAEAGATFVDASESGDDVFFVTDQSLVPADLGAVDLYDARVGGGFTAPQVEIPCFGDACQELPGEPVDPALNTVVAGPGNPKVFYFRYKRKVRRCTGKAKKRAKCQKQKGSKRGKSGKTTAKKGARG